MEHQLNWSFSSQGNSPNLMCETVTEVSSYEWKKLTFGDLHGGGVPDFSVMSSPSY